MRITMEFLLGSLKVLKGMQAKAWDWMKNGELAIPFSFLFCVANGDRASYSLKE